MRFYYLLNNRKSKISLYIAFSSRGLFNPQQLFNLILHNIKCFKWYNILVKIV